ncbi:hypothetical protein [Kistimonas asteriae]|uniref:hypothetical protein n=1 Tax=Kistimonas asteriae TaxID=517724 RepID=UPI001BAA2612|nr:hypothetical protein [Kistimonas asteriae]
MNTFETQDYSSIEVAELVKFKSDCQDKGVEEVVQKHLIDGASYFFNLYYDEDEEFLFKKSIADSLNVHIRDIVIVGSGKLGFSIKPDKDEPGLYRFKSFDYDYDKDTGNKKSDLDVAIVSSRLFDEQLRNLYEHTDSYLLASFPARERNQFSKYILKGWIRPDLLPRNYTISPNIEKVQQDLSSKYSRDVNIGIYKSWYFFEKYHTNNIHTLSLNLIA